MPESMKPVSKEALAAFDEVRSRVEADVVKICMAEDDPVKTMGAEAESMIRTGLGFVSKMLRATMIFGAQGILNDEMDWGKTRLPEYGVSQKMMLNNFKRYTEALQHNLSDEIFNEITPYLEYMIKMQTQIAGKKQS